MKWGFTGKTLLINAKTETAAIKPTFRDAWASHRCIVPASWYFEWEHMTMSDGKKKTGDKFMLQPKGSSVTWLCGLYRIEDGLPCYVILTREPSEELRFIHDRMPLMLSDQCIDEWINPNANPAEVIKKAQTDILYKRVS
jgi:putative SOS response-associated peptidase YedK